MEIKEEIVSVLEESKSNDKNLSLNTNEELSGDTCEESTDS